MLRIGDAAKQFNISNRTLRYWEEMGILKSTRMENGYRFYDNENAARIKQIALLRKLRMPIADIERVFIAVDLGAAIDALSGHLESLKNETAVYVFLADLVENLIRHIKESRSLEQLFFCFEMQDAIIASKHASAPQIQLSERNIFMPGERLNNVRIVRLPAMTVASYRAESSTPEADCCKVMNNFIKENNLHERSGFRYFGFNNPSPSEGNPVYGYEMWVTILDDANVPEPMIKKQFGGGLYASIAAYLNEIGERWQALNIWCKNSDKYDVDFSFWCLEEIIDYEAFISGNDAQQLDLLEPIKLK